MIIAVDGPAASGKGTIARALAAHYRLPHLDTGLLYRAVGVAVARAGLNPDCAADAARCTMIDPSDLADPDLRSEAAGALASRVSKHPEVRAALLALRDAGCAVLVVSEELDELLELSDRLHVIAQGRLSPALSREEANVSRIGAWMSGLWDTPVQEVNHAAS